MTIYKPGYNSDHVTPFTPGFNSDRMSTYKPGYNSDHVTTYKPGYNSDHVTPNKPGFNSDHVTTNNLATIVNVMNIFGCDYYKSIIQEQSVKSWLKFWRMPGILKTLRQLLYKNYVI